MFAKDELKSMSRKELEKLLADVQKALVLVKARDHREARKAAAKVVAEYGFSLDEISEAASSQPKKAKARKKAPKKPSKPIFANPEDNSQTWTGKGRQPNWYRAQVAQGTAPDTMRITS
ncbi:MAG: DNA-binding protein [Oceanibulbus sp.]|jgi:DNA-binding protein H-NS|nr:DNA-binding protein [Sulfitobacter sp.]|tara:strand:+ start:13190 stop:13546 length:357 start_codon:yes stop_codon:yes gene_type:complete